MRGVGQNPDAPEPGERSRVLKVAVVQVLAVGVLAAVLGVRAGSWLTGDEGEEATPPQLVAGQVTRQAIPPSTELPLELPLMNVGSEPVEILRVQASEARGQAPLQGPPLSYGPLEPGGWRRHLVRIPAGCRELETGAVRLQVRVGEGEPVEMRLPLSSESRALADQQAIGCSTRTHPTARDLVGLWLLDRDFTFQKTRLTLLFTADGRFRLDDSGDVFAGPVDQGGRYRVDAGMLNLRIQESRWAPCEPDERIQVRAHLLDDGRLHLHFPIDPEDTCATLRGVDWVFSRVAGPDEVPGRAP